MSRYAWMRGCGFHFECVLRQAVEKAHVREINCAAVHALSPHLLLTGSADEVTEQFRPAAPAGCPASCLTKSLFT